MWKIVYDENADIQQKAFLQQDNDISAIQAEEDSLFQSG